MSSQTNHKSEQYYNFGENISFGTTWYLICAILTKKKAFIDGGIKAIPTTIYNKCS